MDVAVKLSKEQIKRYVEGGGARCPYCGSRHIETLGVYTTDEPEINERVHCNACGKSWLDIFKLAELEEDE